MARFDDPSDCCAGYRHARNCRPGARAGHRCGDDARVPDVDLRAARAGRVAPEYSRTHNPTRTALQHCIVSLKADDNVFLERWGCRRHGDPLVALVARALATTSTAPIACSPSAAALGYRFTFVDTTNPDLVILDDVDMVWVESPTTTRKVTDIARLAEKARAVSGVVADNTSHAYKFQQP